jgi:1,4-dihydroxy-2-naphthoate octaprenyltransferase
LPAIAIGLLSVGVLNLNNMRDEASDRKVGKNTLVVKIGGKKAKLYHYFSHFCNGFDGSVCDN